MPIYLLFFVHELSVVVTPDVGTNARPVVPGIERCSVPRCPEDVCPHISRRPYENGEFYFRLCFTPTPRRKEEEERSKWQREYQVDG